MSATLRQVNLPAVTAELLRVAESGDVDEMERLLSRVADINARNRHGMTALMKAAFFGHEPAVRVLLEHGADPNLMRNDSFTALALAAFFGYGEVVKTLIEFGARTEVVTRAGASARAWARARTYEDVARCLEAHAPPKKPVIAIAPTPTPAPDFTIAVTPASRTIRRGKSTSYNVTITPTNGFTGSVTLSVTGLPSGAQSRFTPNPATTTSNFQVKTTGSGSTGTFTLNVKGVNGSLNHTTTTTLIVNP